MSKRQVFVSVLCVAVLSMAVPGNSQVAEFPFLVLEDSQGDVIGPVVGFAGNSISPIVKLVDVVPNPDQPVFLWVRRDNTLIGGPETETWFSQDNCQGNAFVVTGTNHTEGLPQVAGFAYTVAKRGNPGGNQELYRADLGVTPASHVVESKYRPCCNLCNDETGSKTGVPAAFVMDLDAEYPPDYQLGPTP